MYCRNCGNLIDDSSAFCPYCGAQQNVQYQNTQYQYVQYQQVPTQQYVQYQQVPQHYASSNRTNTLAVVGFILSFFFALIGLICSVMGYKEAPKCGGNGKGLAVAGIIISILSMVIGLIVCIVVFATLSTTLYY